MYERLLATMTRSRSGEPGSLRAWARHLLSELAVQDWLVFAYLWVLFGSVAIFASPSDAKTGLLQKLGALIALLVATLVAVRGSILTHPRASALSYRIVVYGVVQASYFLLKGLLPLVSDRAYDAELLALDLKVFGFEPALVMDRFVNLYTTEWFAFFYYGYFFVLAVHVLPFLFVARRMKLFAEFALGLFTVYCVAHSLYMLVPGWGPVRYLASDFQNALVPGFWMERVLEAVNGAGAQKDIFPSLHTAGPLFILLFSFRHRDKHPFRYSWPITGFFVGNIILATMFLRWHYLIDVVAGISLATGAVLGAGWLSSREVSRRERLGLQPVWMPLWPEPSPVPVADPTPEPAIESEPNASLHSARQ